jgi:hypothetical protein
MRLALAIAFAVTLSVCGTAHAQQYKALPVKSYVLTDPDGTPRYLVQYSEESNFRKVYYVKPVKPAKTTPRQGSDGPRRANPKKRFVWPSEIM